MKDLVMRIESVPEINKIVDRRMKRIKSRKKEILTRSEILKEFNQSGIAHKYERLSLEKDANGKNIAEILDYCNHCGARVNAGNVLFYNPKTEEIIVVPFVGLHALEVHDRLDYKGRNKLNGTNIPIQQGIIDEEKLRKVLYFPSQEP